MSSTLSPNMSLVVPGVGSEAGPQYAFDVNTSLTIIDSHNHSPGSGVQIPPSGLNISSDLPFLGNSATQMKSIVFTPQTSLSTTTTLYVKPGSESPSPINDLWFNDGSGTAVQLTSNGVIGPITAVAIPGESYTSGTFTWRQGSGSTTPANFDIGSIILRPNVASTTYGTTLQPNPSIASSFTLTLPNNPSSLSGTSFLQMDTSGNITAGPLVSGGLTSSNISPSAGITGSQLSSSAGITGSQLSSSAGITGGQIAGSTITATNIASSTITGGQIANNVALPGSYATAGGYYVATIIGSDHPKMIRGSFGGNSGSVITGTGFTITLAAAGVYRINYSVTLDSVPSVVISAYDPANQIATLNAAPTTTYADINVSALSAGSIVTFIVMG